MRTISLILATLLISQFSYARDIVIPRNYDYTPIYLWYSTPGSNQDSPTPPNVIVPDTPPAIKVGDKCPECKGTGWLGTDGIVKPFKCHHCKADGIVNENDPILTGIYATASPVSSPEKIEPDEQLSTWSFVYKGVVFYYDTQSDTFVSNSGAKYKVNLSQKEWVKEMSINICTYDSNGKQLSCENCKLVNGVKPFKLKPTPKPTRLDGHSSNETPEDYATPYDVVDRILSTVPIKTGEVFLDVGSGDGRVVIAAAKLGCNAIGIEQDYDKIQLAYENALQAGVMDKVRFIHGDFNSIDWPKADIVFAFLFPENLQEINNKLLKYNRVITYAHTVPGWSMLSHNQGEFYSWKTKPMMTGPNTSGVVYPGNGKTYTWNNLPRNGRCNCSMCTWLKNQLTMQGS